MKHFSLMLVMVLFVMSTALAQRTITGTVLLDGDGEAIGANVVVDGDEGVGTVTEFDGTFSLSVPETAKALEISYTGYTTQVVSIEGVSEINVTLVQGELLTEVVVSTPYFAKSRAEQTGSVSVVDAKTIERVPIATIDNILQGQVAGLQVMAGSGQPGVAAGKLQIRGASSILGSSEPLVFVDGVRINANLLSNINPSDIEDVTVLKDAASTAVYGASGANGVILIKTKSGKMAANTPTVVSYRTQYGITTPTQERFQMMNSAEKLAMEKYLGEQGVSSATSRPGYYYGSPESSGFNQATYDSLATVNTDWQDIFFRNAIMTQHDLSISGGSEKTSFYISGAFLNQEGQAIRSDLKRASTRFNVNHKINDKFSVGLNGTIGYSRRNFVESENSVTLSNPFTAIYLANPYESPFNPDGTFNIAESTPTAPVPGLANSVNVVELTNRSTNVVDEMKGLGNIYVTYEIIKGLTLKTDWGIDFTTQTSERWIDPLSVRGEDARGGAGSFGESYFRDPIYQGRTTLTYETFFGEQDEHKVIAVVGGEMQRDLYRSFGYTGYGLDEKLPESAAAITDAFAAENLDLAAGVGGTQTQNSQLSYLMNGDYIYAGKYIFTASLRRDATSRFGENFRWGTFGAVGVAWNISDESFMEGLTWLDRLKIGMSYGVSGNSTGIGDFDSRSLYGTGTYGTKNTYFQSQAGRPDLRWEKQNQLSVSISYAFLKRINGSLDFYNNITSDLFLVQSLAPSAAGGFSQIQVNSGKMRNRGVDFVISADVLATKDFVWSVNGNINYNDNEILDLGGEDEFEFGTSVAQVGLPYNTHYVVGWAGVDPATGVPLYYDANGNVTESFSDDNRLTSYGTPEPPIVGGFGTSLNYKGFAVSASFSFVQGNTIFNNQSFFQENHNFAQYNLSTEMNTIWQQPGDITEIQGADTNRQFSSKDIEDGSFLRFRNLSLSYALPVEKIGVGKVFSGATIFAQAQNLFTVTKFTGFDPEIDNNIAQFEYPVPRAFTFGVEVKF